MTSPRLTQACPGRIRRWLRRGLLGGVALTGLPAGWIWAQEAVPGMSLRFTVSEQLEASSNPDLVADPKRDRILSRTRLGLGLTSETKVQKFHFDISTDYEAGDFAGTTADNARFTNSRAALSYARESRSSAVNLSSSYSRSPVSDVELFDEFTGKDLLVSGGDREVLRYGFGLETGRDVRWGLSLSGSKTEIRYYNVPVTSDTYDRDNTSLNASVRLSVARNLDLLLRSSYAESKYFDDREYNSTSRSLGVGFRYEIDPALRLTGGLDQYDIETSQNTPLGRVTDTTKGAGGDIGFEKDLANGTVSGTLSSAISDTGRRNTVSLGRAMELPTGALSFSASIVDTDQSDANLLFGANYSHAMKRGTLTLAANQNLTSSEDTEAIRSQLSLGWKGDLTPVSSWNAGLSLADYNVTTQGGTDTRRATLSLGYAHELTEDWALDAGYTHVLSQSDAREDRSDDRVFVGLRRSFDLLP